MSDRIHYSASVHALCHQVRLAKMLATIPAVGPAPEEPMSAAG